MSKLTVPIRRPEATRCAFCRGLFEYLTSLAAIFGVSPSVILHQIENHRLALPISEFERAKGPVHTEPELAVAGSGRA